MKIPNLVVEGPILKDVESSLQVSFVLSLVENGLVVRKKMKMWKVYKQMDGHQTIGDLKSSLEFSAQMS